MHVEMLETYWEQKSDVHTEFRPGDMVRPSYNFDGTLLF